MNYNKKRSKHNKKNNKKRTIKVQQKGGTSFSHLQKPFIIKPEYPVGSSYDGGNINTWPGVLGNTEGIVESNYYPYNTNVVDPPIQAPYIIYGGSKKRNRKDNKTRKANKTKKVNQKGKYMKTKINRLQNNKNKLRKHRIKKRITKKEKNNRKRKYKIEQKGGFFSSELVNLGRNITNSSSNFINTLMGNDLNISPEPYVQPIEDVSIKSINKPDIINLEEIYNNAIDKVYNM